MPKESEALEESNSNKSEMIAISQNPPVEEVCISEDEQIDVFSYESKLNDKLRELDLYEDDMTIQQKEELLAVVVASWESAEKEKSRRQFLEEYEAAYLRDQFPFAEESIAHIPLPGDEPCCSSECDLPLLTESEDKPASVTSELQVISSSHSPSEDSRCRRPKRRRRECESQDHEGDHKAQQLCLEQSMSQWQPCLSPKDTPLTSKKRPWLNQKEQTPALSEEACSQKMCGFMADFARVRREMRAARRDRWTYGKPYLLSHRRFFTKKTGKPDEHDEMVGVPAKEDDTSHRPCKGNIPLSRTQSKLNLVECLTSDLCCGTSRANHVGEDCTVTQNHIGNSSCAESNSSECSSVIDVETIVDEEIEEFVLKRKQCPSADTNKSQSKKMKKDPT